MRGLCGLPLALAIAFAAAGCGGPRKPPPKKQEGQGPGPRVTIEDVRLELTDASGQRVWEASGKGLRAEPGQKQGEIHDLSCRFLEKGRVVLTASARDGQVDWLRRQVTLLGDVHAESTLGHGEIRADRATWSVADRTLRAAGNVEYRRGTLTATAPRMSADTALKEVHLTGEEGETMKQTAIMIVMAAAGQTALGLAAPQTAATRAGGIKANKVVIYAEKNLIVATGAVQVTTADGTLWADKMEAITDDKNRLRSAEVTGNVKVDLDWVGSDKKRRRIKAQADRGTYDAAARTIVLIGRVKGNAVEVAAQRTIDLKGDKVTLHLQDSRYEVEGSPVEIVFTEPEPKAETAPK